MQIVTHIGAHVTDAERLLLSLQKNAEALAPAGIRIPPHAQYRRALREAIQAQMNAETLPGERDRLIETILGPDASGATRLVMSNPAFICTPNRVFEGREFYPMVGIKAQAMTALFPGDEMHFLMGTRNPATFIPAVLDQARAQNLGSYLGGLTPLEVRWSDVVRRLKEAVPGARITVWANEDTPLLWGRILRTMAGLPAGTAILGEYDLLSTIMSEEGLRRFVSYLRSHPPQSDAQKSRVVAAFLDKYAKAEEIEEEVDLAGWTEADVAAITAGYEADLEEIAAMEGIDHLSP